MDVTGRRVDEPYFSYDILIDFVYAMIEIIYEHAQNRHTKVEEGEKVGDN